MHKTRKVQIKQESYILSYTYTHFFSPSSIQSIPVHVHMC